MPRTWGRKEGKRLANAYQEAAHAEDDDEEEDRRWLRLGETDRRGGGGLGNEAGGDGGVVRWLGPVAREVDLTRRPRKRGRRRLSSLKSVSP